MNDSDQSLGRNIKMILGTFGIFVIFGFLALILSGFAGSESLEDRAYKGQFSEEVTAVRWANLEEIEKVQSEAFDQSKVDAALEKIGATVTKPAKTDVVVPGSPTFLEQSAEQAAPAEAAAPAVEGADKAVKEAEPKPEPAAPTIKPAEPGSAAPEKETPKPGPVNAAEPKADEKPVEEKAPAKPAPAPAEQ